MLQKAPAGGSSPVLNMIWYLLGDSIGLPWASATAMAKRALGVQRGSRTGVAMWASELQLQTASGQQHICVHMHCDVQEHHW